MKKTVSQDDIDTKWLPKHEEEDNPAELVKQIKWFEEIGFNKSDIIWKYYNFAVYGAWKT